jgi:hypothetical protein
MMINAIGLGCCFGANFYQCFDLAEGSWYLQCDLRTSKVYWDIILLSAGHINKPTGAPGCSNINPISLLRCPRGISVIACHYPEIPVLTLQQVQKPKIVNRPLYNDIDLKENEREKAEL